MSSQPPDKLKNANLTPEQKPTEASSQNTVINATMAEFEEHLPDLMKEHKEAMDLLK